MANNQLTVKRETIDIVTAKVKEFQNKGELFFPENYSPENALKSAWLKLQEIQNKDFKPALEVCTKDSIANALLSMVVQGLNPDKMQCYFIVYGSKLQLQRSYFGSMAVAKSVDENIEDIYADVVYEADEFEYSKVRGKTVVVSHKQKLGNIDKSKIIAAYCTVLYCDGKEVSVIMTLDEIKQAWKQSKMNPVDDKGNVKDSSVHGKFMAEMCKKTVVNKACKGIINSSDDRNLMVKYAKAAETDIAEYEVEQEIAENANKTTIDVKGAIDVEASGVTDNKQEPEPDNKQDTESDPY